MVAVLLTLLTLPSISYAYSWTFRENAQQCANLTIDISGSDGKPPYRVLITPIGPSPLTGNVEVRHILDVPFSDGANSVTFQLKYPENSQFVAVVSDSSGFGSGGTSVAAQVSSSSDASCFDPTVNVKPEFVFSIDPPNQIVQCQATRLSWDNSTVQGVPNFLGIIPGGQSFAIPEGAITTVQSQGTGFSWTPSLRGGTSLLIVGGDARGNGTAGSSSNTVSSGINNDGSCLNSASPSSTPGSPAGGSYPTSTSGAGVGGSHGSSTNIGGIVGGVVGGLVFLLAVVLLIWFFRRREKVQRKQKERPMDLLAEDEGDENDDQNRRNELPQYYQPEPFMVPDPRLSASADHSDAGGRPISGTSMTMSRSGTPDTLGFGYGAHGGAASTTSGGGRKGAGRKMRPVNVIQHDDAGPGEADKAEEVETVELPPAYTSVGKRGQVAATGSTSVTPESAAAPTTTDLPTSTETTTAPANTAASSA